MRSHDVPLTFQCGPAPARGERRSRTSGNAGIACAVFWLSLAGSFGVVFVVTVPVSR
jgi:hypothetical protein